MVIHWQLQFTRLVHPKPICEPITFNLKTIDLFVTDEARNEFPWIKPPIYTKTYTQSLLNYCLLDKINKCSRKNHQNVISPHHSIKHIGHGYISQQKSPNLVRRRLHYDGTLHKERKLFGSVAATMGRYSLYHRSTIHLVSQLSESCHSLLSYILQLT